MLIPAQVPLKYASVTTGSIDMTASETIVIVGAGHAGFQLALFLRQGGHQGKIKLINAESCLPYQRPPLSKAYLKGRGDVSNLAFRPDTFFLDQHIDLVSAEAVAINRSERTISLSSGSPVHYDHLVLATGAQNRRLRIVGRS